MAAWLRYNRRYARNEERDATCRRFLEKEPGSIRRAQRGASQANLQRVAMGTEMSASQRFEAGVWGTEASVRGERHCISAVAFMVVGADLNRRPLGRSMRFKMPRYPNIRLISSGVGVVFVRGGHRETRTHAASRPGTRGPLLCRPDLSVIHRSSDFQWLLEMKDEREPMFLSWFIALGPFLLLAARKPSLHRSLIAFAAR